MQAGVQEGRTLPAAWQGAEGAHPPDCWVLGGAGCCGSTGGDEPAPGVEAGSRCAHSASVLTQRAPACLPLPAPPALYVPQDLTPSEQLNLWAKQTVVVHVHGRQAGAAGARWGRLPPSPSARPAADCSWRAAARPCCVVHTGRRCQLTAACAPPPPPSAAASWATGRCCPSMPWSSRSRPSTTRTTTPRSATIW